MFSNKFPTFPFIFTFCDSPYYAEPKKIDPEDLFNICNQFTKIEPPKISNHKRITTHNKTSLLTPFNKNEHSRNGSEWLRPRPDAGSSDYDLAEINSFCPIFIIALPASDLALIGEVVRSLAAMIWCYSSTENARSRLKRKWILRWMIIQQLDSPKHQILQSY